MKNDVALERGADSRLGGNQPVEGVWSNLTQKVWNHIWNYKLSGLGRLLYAQSCMFVITKSLHGMISICHSKELI